MNFLQVEFCISPSERLDEASRISVQEAVSNLISAFSDSKDVDTRCGVRLSTLYTQGRGVPSVAIFGTCRAFLACEGNCVAQMVSGTSDI